MVGMVEDVPETFENVQKLLNILQIKHNHIITAFASDLKLNILIGIQGHSSNHPCCYCTILTGARTDGAYQGFSEPRTFGNLRRSYQAFVTNGRNLKKAMDFDSVVNPSILKGDSDDQKASENVSTLVSTNHATNRLTPIRKPYNHVKATIMQKSVHGTRSLDAFVPAGVVAVCSYLWFLEGACEGLQLPAIAFFACWRMQTPSGTYRCCRCLGLNVGA